MTTPETSSTTVNPSDKLHQLNVTYSNREDRLLLRVTTQQGDEYRLWMSRRFTNLLFNVLKKEMEKHGGVTSVGASRQAQEMFNAGAFEKSFEHEKSINLPLGEEGFLAYGIKTHNNPGGNMSLEIFPEKGQGINLNLNQGMLYMFYNLLSQGIIRAEWHRNIEMFQEEASQHIH